MLQKKNEPYSYYYGMPFTRADLLPCTHPPDGSARFVIMDTRDRILHVGRWERVPEGPPIAAPGRFVFQQ